MTEEEFDAALALEGLSKELNFRTIWPSQSTEGTKMFIGRVVEQIRPDATDEGPYRYGDMARVLVEVACPTREQALTALIDWHINGGKHD